MYLRPLKYLWYLLLVNTIEAFENLFKASNTIVCERKMTKKTS